jgi:dienelactone hydrolase
MGWRWLGGLAGVSLSLLAAAAPAWAMVVESRIDLPVEVKDRKGQIVRHTIPVNVTRDTARTGQPFLILNHGRAPYAADREKMGRARYSENARYFASLGYAVFVPTRIGYGVTGGPDVEDTGGCKTKVYPPGYEAGAQQSVAVIEHARRLPYVDPTRGLVVGQSYGGTIAIALAAKNIQGVVGAINFAGGGGGNPKTQPGRPCRPDLLEKMFASYGVKSRIPTLWLYSENDQFLGNVYPHQWFEAFKAKGGRGEFVRLPAHGEDGHGSFTSNPSAWQPAFEKFLKGL